MSKKHRGRFKVIRLPIERRCPAGGVQMGNLPALDAGASGPEEGGSRPCGRAAGVSGPRPPGSGKPVGRAGHRR